jgi:hypothetical protein
VIFITTTKAPNTAAKLTQKPTTKKPASKEIMVFNHAKRGQMYIKPHFNNSLL